MVADKLRKINLRFVDLADDLLHQIMLAADVNGERKACHDHIDKVGIVAPPFPLLAVVCPLWRRLSQVRMGWSRAMSHA